MAIAQRLLHGTMWTAIGVILSRLMAVAVNGITGRILGKEDFGYFAIIAGALLMLSPLAGGPFLTLVERYVSLWKISDRPRCGRIVALSFGFASVSGLLCAVAMFLNADLIATRLFHYPHTASYIRIAAPYLVFSSLAAVGNGLMVAFQAYRRQSIANVMAALVALPPSIALVNWFGVSGALVGLTVMVAVNAIWLMVEGARLCRAHDIVLDFRTAWFEVHLLHSFALPTLVNLAVMLPIGWIGQLLLLQTPDGNAAMGLFGAANYLRAMALILPGMVAPVMLPLMMETMAKDDGGMAFRRIATLNLRVIALVVFPVCLLMIAGAQTMIRVIYGREFIDAWVVLGLMAASVAFQSLAQSVMQIAIGRARMWLSASINGTGAVAFIALAFWLVRPFGPAGLALAFIGWQVLVLALVMAARDRTLDAPIEITEIRVVISGCILMGLAFAVASLLPMYIDVVAAAILSVVGGGVLYVSAFSGSERATAMGALRQRLAALRAKGLRDHET